MEANISHKGQTKVLVVGQTPPPFGGQAVMIQKMLDGHYQKICTLHVRMNFSDEMDDIGRFQLKKLWRLLVIIIKILTSRFRENPHILYYPPAGPNRIPFLRDALILTAVRPFFKHTVFHFHASGLGDFQKKLSWFEKRLFATAYAKPDLTIRLSPLAPPDHLAVQSMRDVIIPNGIEDAAIDYSEKVESDALRILFVGVVCAEKGADILVEACHLLANRGVDFSCAMVGRPDSQEYEKKLRDHIAHGSASSKITLTGVLTGRAKFDAYQDADVFCFPTHFPSETLPLVIIEAMQFSLPVVTTDWKAIPDLVVDGGNGFLVPVHSPALVAEKLYLLANDKVMRSQMGRSGRARFLRDFQIAVFQNRMERALTEII